VRSVSDDAMAGIASKERAEPFMQLLLVLSF